VLLAGSLLFAAIARSYLFHPVASGAPFKITFGSSDAITIARVGFGGFPLALAVVFIACQISGRLLAGLGLLATTALVLTARRRDLRRRAGTVHHARPQTRARSLRALDRRGRARVRTPKADARAVVRHVGSAVFECSRPKLVALAHQLLDDPARADDVVEEA